MSRKPTDTAGTFWTLSTIAEHRNVTNDKGLRKLCVDALHNLKSPHTNVRGVLSLIRGKEIAGYPEKIGKKNSMV
jgi:hypothetical protein